MNKKSKKMLYWRSFESIGQPSFCFSLVAVSYWFSDLMLIAKTLRYGEKYWNLSSSRYLVLNMKSRMSPSRNNQLNNLCRRLQISDSSLRRSRYSVNLARKYGSTVSKNKVAAN